MSYTQAFLPVVLDDGSIVGLFAIASHAFVGDETTYALGTGSVPVALFSQGNKKRYFGFQQDYSFIGEDTSPVSDGSTANSGGSTPSVTQSNEATVGYSGGSALPVNTGSAYSGDTAPTKVLNPDGSVSYTSPLAVYVPEVTASDITATQFMGATFAHLDQFNNYASHLEFVPLADVMPGNRHFMPAVGAAFVETPGYLLDALMFGSATTLSISTPSDPIVDNPSAALTWTANAPFANQQGRVFFDINWVGLFQVAYPSLEPASIIVLTNPAEGDFKAYVVGNTQDATWGITANTIRIVKTKLGNVPAGTRDFTFDITDSNGSHTTVTLTLTVQ